MFYGFIPAVAPAAAGAGASSVLAHANEKLMPMLARVAQLAEGAVRMLPQDNIKAVWLHFSPLLTFCRQPTACPPSPPDPTLAKSLKQSANQSAGRQLTDARERRRANAKGQDCGVLTFTAAVAAC